MIIDEVFKHKLEYIIMLCNIQPSNISAFVLNQVILYKGYIKLIIC